MSALAGWRARFRDENHCPWPGPKPLEPVATSGHPPTPQEAALTLREASRQLRGRDLEVSDLSTACLSNDVVVVHGQSGVGKSSMINVGLIPVLETLEKKKVIVCKEWAGSVSVGPSTYVTQFAIAQGKLTHDPFAGELDAVDREFPNQLVIVLDQFEELIRSDPGFAQQVLRWIEEVAGRTSAKFVLSLRSEYEWQLRDLRTRPFTKRARVEVRPIEDRDTIETIISGDPDGDADGEPDVMPIEPAAAERLCTAWDDTRTDSTLTAWSRPGLLHLQATLYVLWTAREQREGGPAGEGLITVRDVELLQHLNDETTTDRDAATAPDRSIFGFGLERSVQASISNCESACQPDAVAKWAGIPRVITDQTRWIFRDITEYLASGGYKTQQDLWDLAHKVLASLDEPLLRGTPTWAPAMYASGDWLDPDGADAQSRPSHALSSLLASGPAAALDDTALLTELYRCYFFALDWMRESNLVQVLPSSTSHRVTLTHDRFSEGLAAWRETQTPDFREAAFRYLAHRGKRDLSWDDLEPGLGSDRVVANVRWAQCVIRDTAFENVTFVNCDFGGTTFDGCTFTGITFVNCVLDDVDFVRCSVVGAPGWTFDDAAWDQLDAALRRPLVEDAPTFRLPIDPRLATDLVTLTGGGAGQPAVLVSPPSGGTVAAVADGAASSHTPPATESDAVRPELPQTAGGLVMCGGRLSSLTFRRCTFEDGAKVVLRHIAGTSLEVCEQTHGVFDIFAAAIRGLTVTLPLGSAPDGSEAFAFDVRHAKVINTWLGVDLVGAARFHDCNVWQLINASPRMTVDVTNSAHVGLLNAGTVDDASLPLAFVDLAEPEDIPKAAAAFTEDGLSERALLGLRQVSANIDVQENS